MLGRSADALFWMGRYVERADNVARLIDVGRRTAPSDGEGGDWEQIIRSSGCADSFYSEHAAATRESVLDFLLYSLDTPCSIRSCILQARNNARVVRTSLTAEMWEVIDGTWQTMRRWQAHAARRGELRATLSWIKRRCALFRGVTESTVLRHEGYDFLRLGTYLERADCTARILDVRHDALEPAGPASAPARAPAPPAVADPEAAHGFDAVARHHWIAILRACSSVRAYHWEYRSDYRADRIVHLLVLNAYCSRSLAHCMEVANERLERLARIYARRHECHTLGRQLLDELRGSALPLATYGGLHGFLSSFIARNNALSMRIGVDYHFAPPVPAAGGVPA